MIVMQVDLERLIAFWHLDRLVLALLHFWLNFKVVNTLVSHHGCQSLVAFLCLELLVQVVDVEDDFACLSHLILLLLDRRWGKGSLLVCAR